MSHVIDISKKVIISTNILKSQKSVLVLATSTSMIKKKKRKNWDKYLVFDIPRFLNTRQR